MVSTQFNGKKYEKVPRAASAAAFSWLILSSSSSQTICSTFPFLEAPEPSESGFDDMCAKLVSTSSSSRSFCSNPVASNGASASRCFSKKRDRSTSGSIIGSPIYQREHVQKRPFQWTKKSRTIGIQFWFRLCVPIRVCAKLPPGVLRRSFCSNFLILILILRPFSGQ